MSKFETRVKVVKGCDVTQIKPQNPPTTEDPRDDWGFIENVIRNTRPVSGKVTTIPIPLESIIGPDALGELKAALRDCEHGPIEISISAVHGRCVEARILCVAEIPWAHLASGLLGLGGPCDDFRIDNGTLYASLKTYQQQTADKCARSLDEMFRAQLPRIGSKWNTEGLYSVTVDAQSTMASSAAKASRRKKKKIPEGAAQFVMRVIEKQWPTDAVEIEELVVAVEKIMPPKLDGAGKNRTARYIREAVDKLIARDVLYLHDKTQVSLHED